MTRRLTIMSLLILGTLTSCAKDDGVHQSDVDSVQSQLDEANAQIEDLQGRLDTVTEQRNDTASELTDARVQAGALQDQIDVLTATTTTTAPQVPVEVTRFAGSSDTQTPDFTVQGVWTLHADVTGGAGLNVDVSGPGGDFVSFDPGASDSRFRIGGTYHLDISTYGSTYTLVVIDEPG